MPDPTTYDIVIGRGLPNYGEWSIVDAETFDASLRTIERLTNGKPRGLEG